MQITYTPHGQLILTAGNGAENYITREEGLFQVKYSDGIEEFPTLVGAFIRYYTFNGNASIWDITEHPVLIESKILLSGSNYI